MTDTPAEAAERLVTDAQALATHLRAVESGDAIFTREDVDRIVAGRLARDQKRTRRVEAERDELEADLDRVQIERDELGTELCRVREHLLRECQGD